jgi:hypothetical protein
MNKWRRYNGALIPVAPPHIKVDCSNIEVKVKETNAYFARWTSDFDCDLETEFWHVICDQAIAINSLSRNTRSKIRRGTKYCVVKLINKDSLIENGYDCYFSAFSKYNTYLQPKTKIQFQKEIESLDENWDFWGVFHDNKMIGYSQNRVIDDSCDYSTIKFHPDSLKFYSSYTLFYTMNQYYLNEKSFRYVNDGARSISHKTNIQSFLIDKFKFRKAYCKLNIIYSPKVKLILSIIYPIRWFLSFLDFGPFVKLNVLMFQEKIRRSYER